MKAYTEQHAKSGLNASLPTIECWENQFPGYEIEIIVPEYTAICPKTGLPDFGTIRINYVPDQWCNLGIFYENAVNRILQDLVAACRPISMKVRGEFTPRGGIQSRIEASFVRA
jgi:7-cyano-7-deazaguanine reductase